MDKIILAIGGYFVLKQFFNIDLLASVFGPSTTSTLPGGTSTTTGTNVTVPPGGTTATNIDHAAPPISVTPTPPPAASGNYNTDTNPTGANLEPVVSTDPTSQHLYLRAVATQVLNEGEYTTASTLGFDQWNFIFSDHGVPNLPVPEDVPGLTDRWGAMTIWTYVGLLNQTHAGTGLAGGSLWGTSSGMGNAFYIPQGESARVSTPMERMIVTRYR